MPKSSRGLISELIVRNEQCQQYGSGRSFLNSHLSHQNEQEIPTGNGDWRIRRLNIRPGQNLITWTISNNRQFTTLSDIIFVPKIDIVGLAFTPSCTPCAKGSFSKTGAKQCEACQPGYYSSRGAAKCEKCEENEYSGLRWSKCLPRPACQSFDYFPTRANCMRNVTKIAYHRLQPEVCKENEFSNAKRPVDQPNAICRQCSPGMYRSADGTCRFCGHDEFSADGSGCHKCPEKTTPNFGYFFTNFEQLPSQLFSTCEYLSAEDEDTCSVKPSWIPLGDRIQTAPTRAVGVALELSLNLTKGFFNPLKTDTDKINVDNPIGFISFDLELNCADDSCLLYFVEVNHDKAAERNYFHFIAAFNGTQKRQIYQFPIIRQKPTRFVFAFTRSGAATESDIITDRATIYSLNVTHVGDAESKQSFGGADSCLPCPFYNSVTGDCRPCPPGNYVDLKNNTCELCPRGTIINMTSSQIGIESCTPCGANLDSEDRLRCVFTGKLNITRHERSMKFDMSPLKNKSLSAEGVKVFAREGNSYFHRFNVSLFGVALDCRDAYDFTLVDSPFRSSEAEEDNNAVFCRSTMMPSRRAEESISSLSPAPNNTNDNRMIAMSSFVISHKLSAVTMDRNHSGFYLSDALLEYEASASEVDATRPVDVHFFYQPTIQKAQACRNGTVGVVTVRCDPSAVKEPQVRLSRACPDGTCDGCLFHVFVHTASACPLCDPQDYEEIRGECVNGYQKIHSIPFKHCAASGGKSIERVETCSSSSSDMRLVLLLLGIVIACLVVVVAIFYQRNRSLQYRYSRIIEGKEPDDINSCGLESEEDEEMEEDDASKTRVFFGKKKNDYVAGISKGGKPKKFTNAKGASLAETTDFLSDTSD